MTDETVPPDATTKIEVPCTLASAYREVGRSVDADSQQQLTTGMTALLREHIAGRNDFEVYENGSVMYVGGDS